MLSAFGVSTAFLVSYVVYHIRVKQLVLFQGQGWIRPVYFALLTSHTILAIVIVPLILITVRRAWLEKFDKHRQIARWTLPLWFYVCVTGCDRLFYGSTRLRGEEQLRLGDIRRPKIRRIAKNCPAGTPAAPALLSRMNGWPGACRTWKYDVPEVNWD